MGLDLLRLVLSQVDLLMCNGLLASFTLQKAGESIPEVNVLIEMATTELVFQKSCFHCVLVKSAPQNNYIILVSR